MTIVLPKAPADEKDLNEILTELLAPFDENERVDPYHQYCQPCPADWEITIAHREKFKELQDSGIERREAWKMVWGEENTDSHIDYPRSVAIDHGIHPADDQAIAAWYNAEYGGEDEDTYYVDEGGLYCRSSYNPKSRWDWWSLGGRWCGFYIPKLECELPTFRGRDSWAGGSDRGGVDVITRGDVDCERMLAHLLQKYEDEYRRLSLGGRPDPFEKAFDKNATLEQYVAARLEEYGRPWYTFALLAEGEWREPGRMGWFGSSTDTQDDREKYHQFFDTFWDKMPGDTYVACVDVHI